MSEIPLKITMLKLNLRLNNKELAEKLGVSAQTITNWLKHPPKFIKPITLDKIKMLEEL